MSQSTPNARHCYCKPGETHCGTCERCGVPGHTRHFPGPVPYTGAWCDRCYRFVGIRHAVLRFGLPFMVIAGAILISRSCGT